MPLPESFGSAQTGGAQRHGRQLVRAPDLVLRAHSLDVQCRDAQVAVVQQRQLDQALQPRVDEELLPVDLGGGQLRAGALPADSPGKAAATGAAGRSYGGAIEAAAREQRGQQC